MIKLKNVSFSYGDKKILDNYNLTINDGERICLFGKSGLGKTTILRLILSLEKPNSGEIINNLTPCVIFQEDRLLPFRTVKENIQLFTTKSDSEIISVLNELGIAEYENKYPKSLSGGIARRAALARMLLSDGDVYIFDEPFAGLDLNNTDKAINLINKITDGKTVILVTHNADDAKKMGCIIKEL